MPGPRVGLPPQYPRRESTATGEAHVPVPRQQPHHPPGMMHPQPPLLHRDGSCPRSSWAAAVRDDDEHDGVPPVFAPGDDASDPPLVDLCAYTAEGTARGAVDDASRRSSAYSLFRRSRLLSTSTDAGPHAAGGGALDRSTMSEEFGHFGASWRRASVDSNAPAHPGATADCVSDDSASGQDSPRSLAPVGGCPPPRPMRAVDPLPDPEVAIPAGAVVKLPPAALAAFRFPAQCGDDVPACTETPTDRIE